MWYNPVVELVNLRKKVPEIGDFFLYINFFGRCQPISVFSSSSEMIFTPSACAFVSLLPAASPATT